MLTRRNAKAYAVLAILIDLADDRFDPDNYDIEAYVNGREIGFCVSCWEIRRKVCFSENRNSDNIVVYTGKINEFSMQGNTPDDAVYKRARYYDHDAYLVAAKDAFAYLAAKEQEKEVG